MDAPIGPRTKLELGHKFVQTVNEAVYNELASVAEDRGITLQGLIRAVIIPEWMARHRETNGSVSHSAKRGPCPRPPKAVVSRETLA